MDKAILILVHSDSVTAQLASMAHGYQTIRGQYQNGQLAGEESLFPDIFLIITENCSEQLAELHSLGSLPSYLPVLVLCNNTPPCMPEKPSARFVDYMNWPASSELFQAKLLFCKQLYSFSYQREMFLKTHDSLMDSITRRDGLTGLYNRHHLNKQLEEELQTANLNNAELSLLIIDLDYFNQINRAHGHSFGDFVLNEMSARLTNIISGSRSGAICCRFSGGNFAVLLPKTNLPQAEALAEKIRLSCCKKVFKRGSISTNISLSIGIASRSTHQPESPDQFITMTETALYTAKADGKNRTRVFSPLQADEDFSTSKSIKSLKFSLDQLLQKTRSSAISSLQLLTRDLGGSEQREHSAQVTRYLHLLGKQLGLPETLLHVFENTSILLTCIRFLLHNDILTKDSTFTEAERKLMQDLPYKTAEITESFDFFAMERALLLTQGERFDGSGFPDGLQGDEIPISARLFNLVDSFAAMTADRPHRGRLPAKSIVDELLLQAGKQFDPALVCQLLVVIEQNGLLNMSGTALAEARRQLNTRFPGICQ